MTTTLTQTSENVLEALRFFEGRASKKKIMDHLSISDSDYQAAKTEVLRAGLAISRRGRGGVLCMPITAGFREPTKEELEGHKPTRDKRAERVKEIEEIVLASLDCDREDIRVNFHGPDKKPIIEVAGKLYTLKK